LKRIAILDTHTDYNLHQDDIFSFMTIPSNINSIVESLNRELDEIEQIATTGQSIARQILDKFPNNARLIQFFATFSNALLFAEVERRRIQSIIENISSLNIITEETIQEVGEDLSLEMGKVLETKSLIINLRERLEDLL
jgi:GTP1/Obg family GTP-binding protein